MALLDKSDMIDNHYASDDSHWNENFTQISQILWPGFSLEQMPQVSSIILTHMSFNISTPKDSQNIDIFIAYLEDISSPRKRSNVELIKNWIAEAIFQYESRNLNAVEGKYNKCLT